MSSRHNVGLSHRQGIMCKMPGSQHQTCSETSKAGATFSPSPHKHGPLGPLLLVVREKLGQTHENPCFKGGRMKPSCFCASGEGKAIPKLSGLGLRAHRWERGCRAGWAPASVTACREKSSEVGREEIRDPWLEDRRANCLCICTVGHVDRAVKHDGSEEANSSCIFGRASKAAPDGEAEGSGHAAAISTPRAVLAGVLSLKALAAGCPTESGNRWLLLNTGDSY